jgi:hypothetical protein
MKKQTLTSVAALSVFISSAVMPATSYAACAASSNKLTDYCTPQSCLTQPKFANAAPKYKKTAISLDNYLRRLTSTVAKEDKNGSYGTKASTSINNITFSAEVKGINSNSNYKHLLENAQKSLTAYNNAYAPFYDSQIKTIIGGEKYLGLLCTQPTTNGSYPTLFPTYQQEYLTNKSELINRSKSVPGARVALSKNVAALRKFVANYKKHQPATKPSTGGGG